MDDSMAQGERTSFPVQKVDSQPFWQSVAATIAAVALSLLFLSSGLWKLIDPISWSERLVQALVPRQLALAGAIAVGMAETLGAILVIVPRWRRWGAWVCGGLLLVFMTYFAANYKTLQGGDCSCFPWLKRVVGPGFFVSDAAMLLLAALAGLWSHPSKTWKQAAAVLGVIVIFAGALYGYQATRGGGVVAPPTINVNGAPFPLREGKVFVFFFDPECAHCFAASKDFSTYHWKSGIQLVAAPTVNPKWGAIFLKRTGFNSRLTPDQKILRGAFQFTDPPYAVTLDNGRLIKALPFFDDAEPRKTLKAMGWIE
jgi:uncharacterized membrane protein YphA (DoxX/SURF4 family)